METDAKGQLGGLEMGEGDRKRFAEMSKGWKCGVCGSSNAEILEERAEAARAKEEKEGKREEDVVPEGLTMQYKDGGDPASASSEVVDESEEAELAEGFVQTAPLSLPDALPPARPAQSVPLPTGSSSSSNDYGASRAEVSATLQQRNNTTAPQQSLQERAAVIRRSTDGVPIWIDRAIAGVVICLIFMVLKVLLMS
jgi:ubiquitin-conjugating enzyme E2 J1